MIFKGCGLKFCHCSGMINLNWNNAITQQTALRNLTECEYKLEFIVHFPLILFDILSETFAHAPINI